MGEAHLFFGCRKSTSDFIYQDDMAHFRTNKIVTDVITAFSREGASKVYVQDMLRSRGELLRRVMFEGKGNLYICGNTKMGMDVQAVLKEHLGDEVFRELERDKRLIKELWG